MKIIQMKKIQTKKSNKESYQDETDEKSKFGKVNALFNKREGTKPTKIPTTFGLYGNQKDNKFPQRFEKN